MSIKAELHLSHPEMVLGDTLEAVEAIDIRPELPLYGNESEHGLFAAVSAPSPEDRDRFEAAVVADDTIESFRPVTDGDAYWICDFTIADEAATLFTPPAMARSIRISEVWNEGDKWATDLQAPDRDSLSRLVDAHTNRGATITIRRLYSETTAVDPQADVSSLDALTDAQRDALVTAYEEGYYDEPRTCSLADIGDRLDISPSATGRRLRRGVATLLDQLLDEQ